MFEPEIDGVLNLMLAVCPEEQHHVYLDVLALEDSDNYVEDVIKDFYITNTLIPDNMKELFLRSPYHVSWHTDSQGNQYRLVVIDNRHVAALYSNLTHFQRS
jgi:hypothetical protein